MAELLVVLFVLLLVFGSSKIPALGDGLGRAIRNFKNAVKDEEKPK
jgi:sec-independent protein translocase protein TatA